MRSRYAGSVVVSAISLLSLLSLAALHYRDAYQPADDSPLFLAAAATFSLAFLAGWAWGLFSASRGSRRALIALLVYDSIQLVLGLTTMIYVCPSVCRTEWPFGQVSIWGSIFVGWVSMFVLTRALFYPRAAPP